MIMPKPKKLLFWILSGLIAYQLFGYLKMHTYADVVVYKRLAKAIMKNDDHMIRYVSDDKTAARILNTQIERDALFYDSQVLLTYYSIKSRRMSPDGKNVYLTVEQVSRVNAPGHNTLLGTNSVRLEHEVQLVLKNDHWVVAHFEDPVINF